MNLNDLKDLYRHMEWADALVWRALLRSESARADEKIREYFYHLHLVQHAWLRAWRGQANDSAFPKFDDARSLMRWGRDYYEAIFAQFENLTEESISAEMKLPWAEIVERELGRAPERISIRETMLQIPLHSLYHRGQVNARLRAVGGEPATVDYIVWLWLDRPEADWKFEEELSFG